MVKKIFISLFVLLTLFLNGSFLSGQENHQLNKNLPELLFFYSESCHACHKARREIMPVIEQEFYRKISIRYLDIANVDNYKLMLSLKQRYNCKDAGVPTVFLEGAVLVGYDGIKDNLRGVIIKTLKEKDL
ncbi:MAG: hypothetical protein NC908_05065, partial [Candidatus Omnitrophica bacterium]|nr:hypothetical protein [Candidatus Omnitrophota bacterium]